LRFRPPDRFLEKASAAQEESDQGTTIRNPGRKPLKKAKSHVTVWIVRAKTPVPVKVRTGISDGISTEIREGLSENDEVIVASAHPETAPAAGANLFAPGAGRKLP
jgi:multidrug efflux pump subunit AcrA (membrane-fusion protein)